MKQLLYKKGFTLVETLLAVAILSMAVVAPLSIVSRGLSAATTGKDRFIATALAREAVEYVRNVRDTDRLAGDPWLDSLKESNTQCDQSGGCVVDTLKLNNDNRDIVKVHDAGQSFDNTILLTNGTTGLYSFKANNGTGPGGSGSWSPSQFTRYVEIDEVANNKEVRVTATVSWKAMFSTKEVVITDQLTNW